MSVNHNWLFFVPTALMIAFCVSAMIYVATRPAEHSRPKRYAISALAIMLLSQFAFPLMNILMNWFVSSGNMLAASGIISILVTGAMIFSIALLIIAVFLDRRPAAVNPQWDPGGTPLAEQPSDNPYAAPRQ